MSFEGQPRMSGGSAGGGAGGGGTAEAGGEGQESKKNSIASGGGAAGAGGERGSVGGGGGERGSVGGGGGERGSVGGGGERRMSNQSGGEGAARVSFGEGQGGEPRKSTGEPPRGSIGEAPPRGSKGSEPRGSGAGIPPASPYYEEVRGEHDDNIVMEQQRQELEEHDPDCTCDECECPEEEDAKSQKKSVVVEEPGETYQLDEFMRAKAYFQQISNKSGLSLYDHLSEVIRKFLDERAPNNPVDYLEEVSMNVKRYRFGLKKEDPLQDAYYMSDLVLTDAKRMQNYWKTFAKMNPKEIDGEGGILPGGGFQNLLRLQYYLEQVNIGLSREEMFRVALGIKELTGSRPQIGKLRFWGKIFGTQKNYYVVEAELAGGTDQAVDLWIPKEDEALETAAASDSTGDGKKLELDAVQTFTRAKDVVLNHEFLQAYSKTSGLSPDKQATLLPKSKESCCPGQQGQSANEWEGEGASSAPVNFEDPDARADSMKWEGYQQELMQNFPQAKTTDTAQTPAEPDGSGVNRRVFYVCNELGEDWALLPPVTPQHINASRSIRWFLSGTLDNPVKSYPPFPGKEGHYLKALLVRVTAGGMCSPKGYYKSKAGDGEMPGEEDDEMGPEDGEPPPKGNDAVQPVKKYHADLKALININLNIWVHHTSYILPQGRTIWWNPAAGKPKRRGLSEDGSEMEDDDELEDEDEDEEIQTPGKEASPPLFQSISEDKAGDGKLAWSLVSSSSVFPESQVVAVRSNVWTGSNCICTSKGKVSNIYLGDGLKFSPITFCPPQSEASVKEYKAGPELDETKDPTVEQEQSWLEKLALNEIADMEAKFIDNEDGFMTGDEDDETEYEY